MGASAAGLTSGSRTAAAGGPAANGPWGPGSPRPRPPPGCPAACRESFQAWLTFFWCWRPRVLPQVLMFGHPLDQIFFHLPVPDPHAPGGSQVHRLVLAMLRGRQVLVDLTRPRGHRPIPPPRGQANRQFVGHAEPRDMSLVPLGEKPRVVKGKAIPGQHPTTVWWVTAG